MYFGPKPFFLINFTILHAPHRANVRTVLHTHHSMHVWYDTGSVPYTYRIIVVPALTQKLQCLQQKFVGSRSWNTAIYQRFFRATQQGDLYVEIPHLNYFTIVYIAYVRYSNKFRITHTHPHSYSSARSHIYSLQLKGTHTHSHTLSCTHGSTHFSPVRCVVRVGTAVSPWWRGVEWFG